MSTIVLLGAESTPEAFLLLAGSQDLSISTHRDGLFMIFPAAPDSPMSHYFSERQHQEFQVEISSVGPLVTLSADCGPGEVLKVSIPVDGLGEWSIATSAGMHFRGSATWAKVRDAS